MVTTQNKKKNFPWAVISLSLVVAAFILTWRPPFSDLEANIWQQQGQAMPMVSLILLIPLAILLGLISLFYSKQRLLGIISILLSILFIILANTVGGNKFL